MNLMRAIEEARKSDKRVQLKLEFVEKTFDPDELEIKRGKVFSKDGKFSSDIEILTFSVV